MTNFLNAEDLNRTLRDSLIRQEWDPDFAPPEGQYGQGGADPETELKGFFKDADPMILQPMSDAFPRGGDTMDIADKLTEIAYSQQNASAGAFARKMSLIMRDRIAPSYLEDKAKSEFTGMNGQNLIEQLRQEMSSPDSREILDNLSIRTQNVNTLSTGDIVKELKNIGDEYQASGDDFLADEADIVMDKAKSIVQSSDNASQVKSLAQTWKAEEVSWRNPVADKLSTKSSSPPVVKASVPQVQKVSR